MAFGSGERADLLAAALESQPVRESFVREGGDEDLVRAARAGDRRAFGELYQRYARMIHGVLLAKVPVDAVDDLVQDVFMRALARLKSLRESGSFAAWLCTIARNLANDFHRRSGPEEQMDPAEIEIADEPCADDGREAARALCAIRSLPDAYRETLILRLVEGMTGPEIALRTGLTHGSVRVNLHRGMELLRAKLSPPRDQEQEKS
jgi:RNA polymerase sigma-70 factor, ECF subfamily